MILGLVVKRDCVGKSQNFREYVELAVWSQQGLGKCHVKVMAAVSKERRKSSWFNCHLC